MQNSRALFVFVAALAAACSSGVRAAASPTGLAEFGRCLASKGAVFYGASWCPHCHSQRATLGDAMSGVRYVECAAGESRREAAPACTEASVDSFPTWVFADGTRAEGEQSLDELASRTGCSLPGDAAGNRGEAAPAPKPKIIEVPN